MVDYIFENHMDDVGILKTRNCSKITAFVMGRRYVREEGDPEDTE